MLTVANPEESPLQEIVDESENVASRTGGSVSTTLSTKDVPVLSVNVKV